MLPGYNNNKYHKIRSDIKWLMASLQFRVIALSIYTSIMSLAFFIVAFNGLWDLRRNSGPRIFCHLGSMTQTKIAPLRKCTTLHSSEKKEVIPNSKHKLQ